MSARKPRIEGLFKLIRRPTALGFVRDSITTGLMSLFLYGAKRRVSGSESQLTRWLLYLLVHKVTYSLSLDLIKIVSGLVCFSVGGLNMLTKLWCDFPAMGFLVWGIWSDWHSLIYDFEINHNFIVRRGGEFMRDEDAFILPCIFSFRRDLQLFEIHITHFPSQWFRGYFKSQAVVDVIKIWFLLLFVNVKCIF